MITNQRLFRANLRRIGVPSRGSQKLSSAWHYENQSCMDWIRLRIYFDDDDNNDGNNDDYDNDD